MASGLQNIETVESPFRKFVTTIGVFPTAFTDAMTYYECLAYLVKYMEETLIPAINENAEAVEELQTLYIQLKSFVDNYFDNLDVQEEINNKLDEMAEDGSLGELLGTYVQPLLDALQPEINFTPSFYKFGEFEGVMSQERLGAYTGNTCVIDEPLDISDYDVADQFKILCNTRFILNSDMITWTNSYRTVPTFINCVFWGNGNSIVADGLYISTAKFINCVFYNCALIQDAHYVQSARFIDCRFAGTTDFITAKNCGDISFENCQGESDFKARLLNIDATNSTNKNAVDHLRLTSCEFEANDLTELVKFNYSATVEIDGCYFEEYPQGVLNATQGADQSTLIINVSNTKTWNCGTNIFTVASSYRGFQNVGEAIRTSLTFKSCRFGSASATNLANRYDLMGYTLDDCELQNVTAKKVRSLRVQDFTFEEVNAQFVSEITLTPGHLYYAMQARATYTGFVLYAVMTSSSGIVTEKLFDTNNRWTITDEGNMKMKIVTGGLGEGRIIDMGRVGV